MQEGPGAQTPFVLLREAPALDALLERSRVEPVVIFQHDPSCPISRMAYREVAGLPIEAALVDVAHEHRLPRLLEERTGVRHESPQVLVFRDGQVVWSASHGAITRAAVGRAVRGAALGADPQPDGRSSTFLGGLLTQLRAAWDSQ